MEPVKSSRTKLVDRFVVVFTVDFGGVNQPLW